MGHLIWKSFALSYSDPTLARDMQGVRRKALLEDKGGIDEQHVKFEGARAPNAMSEIARDRQRTLGRHHPAALGDIAGDQPA